MYKVEAVTRVSSRASSAHGVRIRRNISMLSLVGCSIEIMNGWVAISSAMVIGLAQGGTAAILYGLVFMTAINLFIGSTLGEMASTWPSAGGQYVWAAVLAPPQHRRLISYFTGFVSFAAWVITAASVFVTVAQYMLALAQVWHPSYTIEPYHVFLIYVALVLMSTFWNCFLVNRLPWFGTFFIYLSLASLVAVIIPCVARAQTYQSSSAVWATYTNEIGWNNAFVVVATGLTNPAYCFLGIDSTAHLAEDSLRPARDVPIAMIMGCFTAFFTAFTTAIALAYTIQDYDGASSAFVPFLAVLEQATRSKVGATVLGVLAAVCFAITGQACHHAVSRLLWSLGVDRGFPFPATICAVHPRLRVPVNAILISAVPIILVAILYVASAQAYNAILASSIILNYISLAIPTVFLMLGGRKQLSPGRYFKLGRFGWVANAVLVGWTAFTAAMWLFPTTPSPTASEMNYAVVVIGIVSVLSLVAWFGYAQRHFQGPTQDDFATAAAVELHGAEAKEAGLEN
ncbi:hypothetical protein JCM6882_008204 [Rhodosporidiobolus microsporus]